MGHYNAANDNQIVQEVPGAIGSAFSTPAYFNHQIYYQGSGDVTKGFLINNGVIVSTPVSRSTTSFSALGGTPSVSANGTNDGIVWTIQSDAGSFASAGPAVFRQAYNATNLALELYNSSQNPARDNPGGAIQMTTPSGGQWQGHSSAHSMPSRSSAYSLFLATPVIAYGWGPVHQFSDGDPFGCLAQHHPLLALWMAPLRRQRTAGLYTGPIVLTSSASRGPSPRIRARPTVLWPPSDLWTAHPSAPARVCRASKLLGRRDQRHGVHQPRRSPPRRR